MIYDKMAEVLNEHPPEDVIIIEGEAPGADSLSRKAADRLGFRIMPFPAHWRHTSSCPEGCVEREGNYAGNLRNQKMLDEGRPDEAWGFSDFMNVPAKFKGSGDMKTRAEKAGIPVRMFEHDTPAIDLDDLEEVDV